MKRKNESAGGNLTIEAERGGRNIRENVQGGRNIEENGEDAERLLVRSCPAGQQYWIQEQPVNKKKLPKKPTCKN